MMFFFLRFEKLEVCVLCHVYGIIGTYTYDDLCCMFCIISYFYLDVSDSISHYHNIPMF